jgi:hypothetical protein
VTCWPGCSIIGGCLGLGLEQPKINFLKKLIFILFVPSPGTSVGMGHNLQQAYLL